jgi:hypothetical protein
MSTNPVTVARLEDQLLRTLDALSAQWIRISDAAMALPQWGVPSSEWTPEQRDQWDATVVAPQRRITAREQAIEQAIDRLGDSHPAAVIVSRARWARTSADQRGSDPTDPRILMWTEAGTSLVPVAIV